jgi:hypothetical protein
MMRDVEAVGSDAELAGTRAPTAAGLGRGVEWDGFRALVSFDAGKVVLRSRRGTETGPAFPEITAGIAQLPDATALDGVV